MLNIKPGSTPYAFTLHVRLTHACNAACTYCSSWQKNPDERMRPADFAKCLDGLERFWRMTGISPDYLNVEYVGGEILLIPASELEEMVMMLRSRFEGSMIVHDGAQSNLIGSERRISHLHTLFKGRVGTSVDHFTQQRQMGGKGTSESKAKRYRTFFMQSSSQIKQLSQSSPPAVLTIDRQTLPYLKDEITLANDQRRNLTIRPVFQGGSEIDKITPQALGEALQEGFDLWVNQGMRTRIEPFVSLLRRRLNGSSAGSFCAWQRDCAVKSLSIEPNGDIFVCQELADTNTFGLGNLISNEFDVTLHQQLSRRTEMLEKGCFECKYFSSCQGGCMQQSAEAGTGMYGKTQWCQSWKMLFSAIDELIERHTPTRLLPRLETLHPEF